MKKPNVSAFYELKTLSLDSGNINILVINNKDFSHSGNISLL